MAVTEARVVSVLPRAMVTPTAMLLFQGLALVVAAARFRPGLLVGVEGALVVMVVVVTVVVVMVAPLVVMVVTLVRVIFVWACTAPALASMSAASATGNFFNVIVIVFLFSYHLPQIPRESRRLVYFARPALP